MVVVTIVIFIDVPEQLARLEAYSLLANAVSEQFGSIESSSRRDCAIPLLFELPTLRKSLLNLRLAGVAATGTRSGRGVEVPAIDDRAKFPCARSDNRR